MHLRPLLPLLTALALSTMPDASTRPLTDPGAQESPPSEALESGAGTQSVGLHWSDFDGDGRRDAFAVSVDGDARLLRQRSDGLLQDEAAARGLDGLGKVRFGLWLDLNQDGASDLLVAPYRKPVRLFVNDAGWFRELGPDTGLTLTQPVLFAQALDVDGDDRLDLHLHTADGDQLYRNLGQERFASIELGQSSPRISTASPEVVPTPAGTRPLAHRVSAPSPLPSAQSKHTTATVSPTVRSTPDSTRTHCAAASKRSERAQKGTLTTTVLGTTQDAGPPCAFSIDDFGNGGCLMASSTPTLGMLYPLTSTLFVSDQERVGINTTSPSAALEVVLGIPSAGALAAVRAELAGDTGTFAELAGTSGIGLRAGGSTLAAELAGDVNVDGNMNFEGSSGSTTLLLDPAVGSGASIRMSDELGAQHVDLASGVAGAGVLALESDGNGRLLLDGGSVNRGGILESYNALGMRTVQVEGGKGFDAGALSLGNSTGQTRAELLADLAGSGGALFLNDASGTRTVDLRAANSGTSRLLMRGITGFVTLDLAGFQGGGGSLVLSEDDGSIACDLQGTVYSFYDTNGVPTWNFDRITGTESTFVETPSYGGLGTYGVRSTECWIEEFGSGHLVDGVGHVSLDARFLETVHVGADNPFKVFVTLNGESAGVWIQKGTTSFTVVERDGGSSHVAFDWRVVAKRRGAQDLRLEQRPGAAEDIVTAQRR